MDLIKFTKNLCKYNNGMWNNSNDFIGSIKAIMSCPLEYKVVDHSALSNVYIYIL